MNRTSRRNMLLPDVDHLSRRLIFGALTEAIPGLRLSQPYPPALRSFFTFIINRLTSRVPDERVSCAQSQVQAQTYQNERFSQINATISSYGVEGWALPTTGLRCPVRTLRMLGFALLTANLRAA